MARRVAVALGFDCAARHDGQPVLRLVGADRRGWRSTRSRPARATCSSPPASSACPAIPRSAAPAPGDEEFVNPLFDEARARTEATAKTNETWHDPRERRPAARRLHLDGPDRGEPRHLARHHPRGAGRVRRPLAEPRREGDRRRLLRARDHSRSRTPDGTVVVASDDGPRPGVTMEGVAGLKPVFREDGTVTAGNCCPLNDGAAAVVIMSDTQAPPSWASPRSPGSSRPESPACPRRSWASARSRRPAGRCALAGMTDRRHRPGRDQRGVRRPGHPVVPRARHRHRPAQRARRGDRARPPVRLDRRPHHDDAAQRPAEPRQGARPRDDVRRRRPGHGHGLQRLS